MAGSLATRTLMFRRLLLALVAIAILAGLWKFSRRAEQSESVAASATDSIRAVAPAETEKEPVAPATNDLRVAQEVSKPSEAPTAVEVLLRGTIRILDRSGNPIEGAQVGM